MKENLTIGMVGAGGDGVLTLGAIFQTLASSYGYFSQMHRYYGAQIKGGGSAIKMTIDPASPSFPKDFLDILICLDWNKYLEFKEELALNKNTIIICDEKAPDELNSKNHFFVLPLRERSKIASGSENNRNFVALGLLEKMLAEQKSDELFAKIIQEEKSELLRKNGAAIRAGLDLFKEFKLPPLQLKKPKRSEKKIILHGNKAMAKALLRAGCNAFFCYPVTPASEIMEQIKKEFAGNGKIFRQAEDEIAAIGNAIGASLAGAKTAIATSGVGYSLMTEMVGLSSSAEIPLVIIDVERCGPSTGMPSKTEQSDLNQAVYGCHGDAPRIVLAPYNIEECYRLTIKGMNMAEYYQTPVIILSDQLLGQTVVATDDIFIRQDYCIENRKKPDQKDTDEYLRYYFAKDNISPMADIGDENFVYQTTGLSHNEKGWPAFDAETNEKMHKKRENKIKPLRKRKDLVFIFGNTSSKKGVIVWGSSAQPVLAAAKNFGLLKKIAICVPELIYPLPEKLSNFAKKLEKLAIVEMNYSGQLHKYLRSELDLPKKTCVYHRAGGRPFSQKELLKTLKDLAK